MLHWHEDFFLLKLSAVLEKHMYMLIDAMVGST